MFVTSRLLETLPDRFAVYALLKSVSGEIVLYFPLFKLDSNQMIDSVVFELRISESDILVVGVADLCELFFSSLYKI